MKRKASPLEEFGKWIDSLTPEEKEKWQDEARERFRRSREECKEEGKKPPKSPEGVCRVCGGLVKAEYVHGLKSGYNWQTVPLGPGSSHCYGWNFKGFNCTDCGLVYKFPPPVVHPKDEG